jgi:hypothetical protein
LQVTNWRNQSEDYIHQFHFHHLTYCWSWEGTYVKQIARYNKNQRSKLHLST